LKGLHFPVKSDIVLQIYFCENVTQLAEKQYKRSFNHSKINALKYDIFNG